MALHPPRNQSLQITAAVHPDLPVHDQRRNFSIHLPKARLAACRVKLPAAVSQRVTVELLRPGRDSLRSSPVASEYRRSRPISLSPATVMGPARGVSAWDHPVASNGPP